MLTFSFPLTVRVVRVVFVAKGQSIKSTLLFIMLLVLLELELFMVTLLSFRFIYIAGKT